MIPLFPGQYVVKLLLEGGRATSVWLRTYYQNVHSVGKEFKGS